MPAPSLARRLLPQKQRIRDLQDELLALRGQMAMAAGIQVIHCCTCGHTDCGAPPPAVLPQDAWVVALGCRLEAPEQVTPEAIAEAAAPTRVSELSPAQQQDYQELLALATGAPSAPARPTVIQIPR